MKESENKQPVMITLNQIRDHSPCKSSWEKLLKSFDKTKADDEEFPLVDIIERLDIQDAIWCLRVIGGFEPSLFAADIAESVLPIFEVYSDSSAAKDCIEAVRLFAAGKITRDKLMEKRRAAAYAYAAAAYAAADAADAAYAYAAAAYAAADAADAAYAAAYAADAAAYARKEKWLDITSLFVSRFGGEK